MGILSLLLIAGGAYAITRYRNKLKIGLPKSDQKPMPPKPEAKKPTDAKPEKRRS